MHKQDEVEQIVGILGAGFGRREAIDLLAPLTHGYARALTNGWCLHWCHDKNLVLVQWTQREFVAPLPHVGSGSNRGRVKGQGQRGR